MALFARLLLWLGAVALFGGLQPQVRHRALAGLGSLLALVGTCLVVRDATGRGAGLGEAIAHLTVALTLLALVVPFFTARNESARKTRAARKGGVGVAAKTTSRYGAGRLSAALLGAPVGGMLVALVLPKIVPATQDLRYLAACIVIVPLFAAAPWFALAARSGARAWVGSAVSIVAALGLYWGTRP